ncbi:MAG: bifunctional riboflavin kinase/FAD synthetase [Prochloraceae cyanobacterium]
MWITSSTAKVLKPNAIALGNFDGIHRGHLEVLRPILPPSLAKTFGSFKIYSTVVSFEPHPHQFFTGKSKKLLTTIAEKEKLLADLGVNGLLLLPFDRQLASLTPQEFVENILISQLEVKKISVGQDFRFGRDRSGNVRSLQEIAAKFGVETTIVSLQNSSEERRISSSLIRSALEAGQLDLANQMLGRNYSLMGVVVSGKQLGRTIGFPTANLNLPPLKLIPRQGVYSVRVAIEPSLDLIKGVMNIGYRPTVSGDRQLSVEVHLLDWSGDLYDRILTVELMRFLRPEQKFSSIEALKSQIALDCQLARQTLDT